MKKALLFPLLLCAVCFGSESTVQITTEASAGNPLENSGHVTLSQRIVGEDVLEPRKVELSIKNVSSKDIVALAEIMGAQETIQMDTFFDATVLKPGDALDFPQSQSTTRTPRPAAVVKTLWVQFSDGTTWGDEKDAAQLMERRKVPWIVFVSLNRFTRHKGRMGLWQN